MGHHPILCYLSAKALAGLLRPGNAGPNTAADQRKTILALPEAAWAPAIRQGGTEREGAWVAELTGSICRAGRRARGRSAAASAHPGAQFSFSDADGHRFHVLLTNQDDDPVALEARHRARASVEDAIRATKDTGLSNLPFRELAANAAWLELVLIAQDLVSWPSRCCSMATSPVPSKRLRYRLLHLAGRITRSGRRIRLHLPGRWPWAAACPLPAGGSPAVPEGASALRADVLAEVNAPPGPTRRLPHARDVTLDACCTIRANRTAR